MSTIPHQRGQLDSKRFHSVGLLVSDNPYRHLSDLDINYSKWCDRILLLKFQCKKADTMLITRYHSEKHSRMQRWGSTVRVRVCVGARARVCVWTVGIQIIKLWISSCLCWGWCFSPWCYWPNLKGLRSASYRYMYATMYAWYSLTCHLPCTPLIYLNSSILSWLMIQWLNSKWVWVWLLNDWFWVTRHWVTGINQ